MDDAHTQAMLADAVARWQANDRDHHIHSFTDPDMLQSAGSFVIDSAKGCLVGGQGVQLLDAMAGLGCVNIGYGHPEMAEAAKDAVKSLSYYHSFAAVSNPGAADLAAAIARLTPADLNHVFFANSGSEANETLLKLIRLYWRGKGQEQRTHILVRDYAYHGSTFATAVMNGDDRMAAPFGLTATQFGVHRLRAPYWYREAGAAGPKAFVDTLVVELEHKIDQVGADKIAAFFIEPIQATGGVVIPPEGYLARVSEICSRHGILVVADEVVSGFGRTGQWFASEAMGLKPDMMTLAKGLSSAYAPISAAVISSRMFEDIKSHTGIFQHGFTTSAHPVSAALALKNIEILERDGLIHRVAKETGPYFANALGGLLDLPLLGEVRVSGLMAGLELVADKETRRAFEPQLAVCDKVSQACLMQGVIVRPVGNALVLCPPLIAGKREIDTIAAALRSALMDVGTALGLA